MDKTLNVLNILCNDWKYKLLLGREYNTPLSIGFSDSEYEVLTCTEHDLKGTGSISHGYDHNNKDETKSLSLVQPKECFVCKSKVHFFAEICECGSNNFKYISDSRWGIDCEAHFKYSVPKYHLWILKPDSYNPKCKKFYLEQYVIESDNKPFNQILKIQMEKGKNRNKNFLPYSADFYASNPIHVSSFTIVIDDIFGVIITRNLVKEINYSCDIIKKMKPYLVEDDFLCEKDNYHYNEIIKYININGKKTSHGKKRGKTTRRLQ
jgi:hypothetical protein